MKRLLFFLLLLAAFGTAFAQEKSLYLEGAMPLGTCGSGNSIPISTTTSGENLGGLGSGGGLGFQYRFLITRDFSVFIDIFAAVNAPSSRYSAWESSYRASHAGSLDLTKPIYITVPLTAGIRYSIKKLYLLAGIGAGYQHITSASYEQVYQPASKAGSGSAGGSSTDYSDQIGSSKTTYSYTDAFSYSVLAGLGFSINRHWGLGLNYRLLGSHMLKGEKSTLKNDAAGHVDCEYGKFTPQTVSIHIEYTF